MMDCKDISSSIKSGTGGRKHFSLLALLTRWQLHCLEKIKNELRGDFPQEQEQILFDKINDQIKKLKHDLIQLDVENLKFIQLNLAYYEVGGDVEFGKFLTKSLLLSYSSISYKVEGKTSVTKNKEIFKKLKEDVQSLRKDTEINFELAFSIKDKSKAYLEVVRDVFSLYNIFSTIESAKTFFQGGQTVSREEKNLVLQKLFHDMGEYTKATKDTPNLSLHVREDLISMGILLDPLNKFRDLLAHQLFPVTDFDDVNINDLFNKGFLSIKEVIKNEISIIEGNFIKKIILEFGDRSLINDLLNYESAKGIKGLVSHIYALISSQAQVGGAVPEKVFKSSIEIYEITKRMKSKDFSLDTRGSITDPEQETRSKISSSITKYVEGVNELSAKRNELDQYSNLFDKLVSLVAEEDKASFENAHNDLLDVKKAINSLRSETKTLLCEISDDFLNKKVFEKIQVVQVKDVETVVLKDELQRYFDLKMFKEKLPLIGFESPDKFYHLLEGVPKRDKNLKGLEKVLKLNSKKGDKIGTPKPDEYEKLVHDLKGISEENKKKLLSYSLQLKKERCIKLLEENLPALDKIYDSIVKGKFIDDKIYADFAFQYKLADKTIKDTVNKFYFKYLEKQFNKLKRLNIPYAIQASILNLYSTWENAQSVLRINERPPYLKALRNYFSHGDILISGQGDDVLAKQLVELKTKLPDSEIESIVSLVKVFDNVLSDLNSGPIKEVLSSYTDSDAEGTKSDSISLSVGALKRCAKTRVSQRARRSIIRCLFSKEDVEKFIKGNVDENNVDKVIIDSEKFLFYIKNSQDEGKNSQLIKFIEGKSLEGDYRYLVHRIVKEQGYERYIQNERIKDLYGNTAQKRASSIRPSKLKGRLINAAGGIMLLRGIYGTIESCTDGTATDCGLSVGGMSWSLASQPIENILVKNSPKFVKSAGQLVARTIPGTLGRQAQFAVTFTGVKLGSKIAKGVAGAVVGVFDIIDIGRSASNLVDCNKREDSHNPCGEKEIRDNIASISFSAVSFTSGIAVSAAAGPVVGIAVGLVLMLAGEVYSGISNIIEFKKKYDTTPWEDFDIFVHSIFYQSFPHTQQEMALRSDLVNFQAEQAWNALSSSPHHILAYANAVGKVDPEQQGLILQSHAKILMNRADANTTNLSRVLPKPIRYAEMICLPQVTRNFYEWETGIFKTPVLTAVHYCEDAIVVADTRRKQNGTAIMYDLTHMNEGTVIGSNRFNNYFLLPVVWRGTIAGGNNTVNRFIFRQELQAIYTGRVVFGINATNILDMSQIKDDFRISIDCSFHPDLPNLLKTVITYEKVLRYYVHGDKNTLLRRFLNTKLVSNYIEGNVDTFRNIYIGRQNKTDCILCTYHPRRIAENDNGNVLINSGGGLSKNEKDLVDNCTKVVILPYTKVTGGENVYTFYVRSSGYAARDLYSEIDVRGNGTVIFPETSLLNDCDEISYFSESNSLDLKISLGQGNQYTLEIKNYINRHNNQPSFILMDKSGSKIIPNIKMLQSPLTRVNFFGVHMHHSLESVEAAENHYKQILGSDKGYKIFGVITENLESQNKSAFQSVIFGSSEKDLINFDQRKMFARGENGSDIYIIGDNEEERDIVIDNNSDDKSLDVLIMQEVPEKFSTQECDLRLNYDNTRIQVRNYVQDTSHRHLMIMNSKGESFVPYVQSTSCVEPSEENGELIPFFHATPTQNIFVLRKDFQGDSVVIDSRHEEIEKYKDKDDLLLIREGEIPFIIKVEDFYNDQGKWEGVNFLLWNDGNFSSYRDLDDEVSGVMDYQEKLKVDYEKSFQEYIVDFTQSINIAHNQDDTLTQVGQAEERIGIMILKDITLERLQFSSSSRDLVLSDKVSKNEIRVKNWDDSESYRISALEFDLGLEPVIVKNLESFSLSSISQMQNLIDDALKACQKRDELQLDGLLRIASQDGDFSKVKVLLNQCASVNAKGKDGFAPLHYGSAVGNLMVVKYMVGKGADLNVQCNLLRTPLHLAAMYGHLVVLQYLIERRAAFDLKDRYGRTPLHYAAQDGQLNVVKYLVEETNADVGARDDYGKTPLDVATDRKLDHVGEYLGNAMNERGVIRRRRHRREDHSLRHLSRKPFSADLDGHHAIAMSGSTRPSSWITDLSVWARSSVGRFLSSALPERGANIKGTISQVDTKIDVSGTIVLLDVMVRKFTGKQYISAVDQSIPLLEARGYAFNITKRFEKVLNKTAIKSGLSVTNLNIDPVAVQSAIIRKIINGRFDEIAKTLYSFAKEACQELKQTEKFLDRLRSNLREEKERVMLKKVEKTLNVLDKKVLSK